MTETKMTGFQLIVATVILGIGLGTVAWLVTMSGLLGLGIELNVEPFVTWTVLVALGMWGVYMTLTKYGS